MELTTPRLILRDFRDSDYDAVHEFETNPVTHHYDEGLPSDEALREKLTYVQERAKEVPRVHWRFAVTIRPEDRVMGLVALNLREADIREWDIGWTTHFDHWGKGYATEAAGEVINFAFRELDAHKIVAFCNVFNTASWRVMEKLGMQREAHLRQAVWWNENWCDEYMYSILDSEWKR